MGHLRTPYNLILSILIGWSVSLGQSPSEQYIVKGRVIDANGKPLANIGICFEPDVYRGGFDRFIEFGATANDGSFEEKVGRNKNTIGQLYYLYTYENSGTKGIDFLNPPFDWLRSRDETFNGIPVRFGEKPPIDLGDVKVQFYFGDAILDFTQLKAKTKANVDWEDLMIAVRQKDGHYVAYMGLSHDDIEVSGSVDKAKSRIRVSLPEGHWKIEAIWDNKVLAESDYFDIVCASPSREVPITPSRSRRHIDPNKL